MTAESSNGWNPTSPHDWARRFGFVASELFPPQSLRRSANDAVLRDGRLLSFTLLADGQDSEHDGLSWSWSANTQYLLVPRRAEGRLLVHRWDQPNRVEAVDLGVAEKRPEGLIALMRDAGPRREESAIDHVMQIFRSLRPLAGDSESAIRLLHRLLRPTVNFDGVEKQHGVGEDSLLRLRERLQSGHPRLNLSLYPELLLRHAAAELFQEAHVEADRQTYFFGMSPPPARIDKLPPEIRYTPASLARVLDELALHKMTRPCNRPRVLDPACGSGVFLTEMAGVAASENGQNLDLVGYDTSSVAVELAKSCLELTTPVGDAVQQSVGVMIREIDSLTQPWDESDIVVMNPPFRAYPDLDDGEREAVADILGDLKVGRPDKALAFLWKAWTALREGGVVAAVLPASLLGGDAGNEVRKAIQATGIVHVIGRFENHAFFKHSLIETGFVVIEKRSPPSTTVNNQTDSVTAVVAKIGEEDDSIRTLRLVAKGNPTAATRDVFTLPSAVLADFHMVSPTS